MDFFCQSAYWASSTIGLLILHIFLTKSENPDILGIFCKSCLLVKDLWSTCHFFWRVDPVQKKLLLFSSERRTGNVLTFFNILVARDCCDGGDVVEIFRIQLKARIFLLHGPRFYEIECRQLIWKRMVVDYFYLWGHLIETGGADCVKTTKEAGSVLFSSETTSFSMSLCCGRRL